MRRLILPLLDTYRGPVLIIGGGPSVPADLARLPADFKPACIISANAHAFKLEPRWHADFIVCCDQWLNGGSTGQPLEPILRKHGAPIISRHPWADYRLHEWKFHGNSGQHAIAVGAVLGGNPVIAAGMDCWQGATYFHDPNIRVACSGRSLGQVLKYVEALAKYVEGAQVRALSGPMQKYFPLYRPGEMIPERGNVNLISRLARARETILMADRPFSFQLSPIKKGDVFAVSETESRQWIASRYAHRLTQQPEEETK